MWRRYRCLTSEFCTGQNSVRGQQPPKMYIWCSSPGDGQTSCKVWLASGERRRCSNAAKTRNLGCPQTTGPMSAAVDRSSPYCGQMWRRYCCLTSFFPSVDTCLSWKDTARQIVRWCYRWRIFGDFFCVSDLHPKFALRPHHVWKYGRHPISDG